VRRVPLNSPTEREQLLQRMRQLFTRCQLLSAQHYELMKEWERLKARVDEIDQTQDRKSLP
jgi:hypothetical protein